MRNLFLLIFLTFSIVLSGQNSVNKVKVSAKSTPSVFPTETGDFRTDMLNYVNAVRMNGCRCGNKIMPPVEPVKWNSQLEKAATIHAADMSKNNFFDHIGTDGSEIDTRVERAGYKWMEVGENIAFGQQTIRQVIIDWIKSPSHCRQLMSPNIEEMGVARSGKYWVQDFGKKRNW